MLLLKLSVLLAFTLTNSDDGIFTSNIELQSLVLTEQEVIKELHNYVEAEEARVKKVKMYVSHYEKLHEEAARDVEKYVANPLNSYLLIKRLTADWKEVKEMMYSSQGEKAMNHLLNKTKELTMKWPSEDDLSGAALALTRLQDMYNLSPGDMSEGWLNGRSFGTQMTANDCFELGRQSYSNGDHAHSLQWMEIALGKLEQEGDQSSIDRASIYEYVAFSWYSQGDLAKALLYTEKLLELEPDHPRAVGNKSYYKKYIAEKANNKKGDDGSDSFEAAEASVPKEDTAASGPLVETDKDKYKRMCRADSEFPMVPKARLKCSYSRGNHPYLTLMPYKVEVVSLKPKISIFYEVISDEEIEAVKALAKPQFKRATVQNYKTGELETATYRISKSSWLQRSEHTDQIYQRVGDITGLEMATSEDLQVGNYGMGGHYEPHYDFSRKEEVNAFKELGTGNRMATWLFYLSDVELGGATVFPRANVTLRPKKGSAAFWYNLFENGEGDFLTYHAACPVLAGTKWVSNFWIHERGQEFRRPCSTDPFK